MSEDQFTKLFKYMQEQFAGLRTELDRKADKGQIDRVYDLLDTIAKNQEIDQQERLVMSHQLDRHEGWIKQLAKKTDTRLSYE